MGEFNFRDLVKPGQGAELTLRNHMKAQVERGTTRPGHIYSGAAELLERHGTFFGGRKLPDKWESLRGGEGECFKNAMEAATAHPELRYFEGLYMVGSRALHHAWCVDPDGELVEVTLEDEAGPGFVFKHETGGTVPWLPPEHWAYVGVEFDIEFVTRHYKERGLPILDPRHEGSREGWEAPWPDDLFKHPYTPGGWDLEPYDPPEYDLGDPDVFDPPDQP